MHLYHLFPPFNLGRSLVQLSALDFRDQVLGKPSDPFKWDILGRPLTYMIVEIFGYMVLTILIDNGTLRRSSDLVWDFVSQASQESRLADSLSGMISKAFQSVQWLFPCHSTVSFWTTLIISLPRLSTHDDFLKVCLYLHR